MSTTVDNKVVAMSFDNKNFEKNAQTSMNTIEKLKKSLMFKDSTKGLEEIDKTAKKLDFMHMSKGIETVQAKFSVLQVSGVTAIANITNFAVNAGKRIASALTIDPIKTGFQEYETQINAVQTILANTSSKGTTLTDVNRALDELNTYADKTIYNFTEMTRNIGTFTAAGVDLDTSVSAIKGIANLAAVSGSTSQQASTAMYQLSQALASGTVKLMDWNSVVNAGMGGQVFQDSLKETARIHGINIDQMIKNEGSFRETLQEGWLTSEILTETLAKFTGDLDAAALKKQGYTDEQITEILKLGEMANDAATKVKTLTQLWDTLKEAAQSGWTQSWEIVVGDFEEAKEVFTRISDAIGGMLNESSEARNKVLNEGLSSGWKQLLSSGIADEEGYKETLMNVAKDQGVALDQMQKDMEKAKGSAVRFDEVLTEALKNGSISSDTFTEAVSKMADKMSGMSDEEIKAAGYTKEHVESIKALKQGLDDGSISMANFTEKMTKSSGRENLIESLFNVCKGLMSVLKPIGDAFKEVFEPLTGDQLYNFTVKLREFTEKLTLSKEQAESLKNTFKGVFGIFKIVANVVGSVISGIAKLIGHITGLSGGVLSITGSIGEWIYNLSETITEMDIFGRVIEKVVGFIGAFINKIKEFGSAITSGFDSPGLEGFYTLMTNIWNVILKIGGVVGKVFSEITGAIGEAFSSGDFNRLLGLFNGGIFASILLGIKKFISNLTETVENSTGFIDNIKDIFEQVTGCLKSLQDNVKSKTLINIAIAVGILAASLWVISGIDPGQLGNALAAITGLFIELMGAMKILSMIDFKNTKGLSKSVTAIIGVSIAVLLLASALKKISDLGWDQLAVGITGLTGLMILVVGAMTILSRFQKGAIKGAGQMILVAVAMKIFVSVCEGFSKMSWEEIGKGVAAIGVILLEFVGMQALLSKIKPSKMISQGLSLVLVAAAMKIFASVCSDFSSMSWEEIGKGVAAIGVILLEFVGMQALLSKIKPEKMLSSATSLILIGAAMEIFADVTSKFGSMNWESLGKAGAAITGILALTTGFTILSKFAPTAMSASVSLVLIGAAMEIFADVANKFGSMDWESLGKAGAAITGILGLAIGFGTLSKFAPGMLKASAALLVMSVALLALTPVLTTLGNMSWESIAKGLLAIAGALAIFGVAGYLLAPVAGPIALIGAAIAALGIGCLAAGAGVVLLAAGISALGIAFTVSGAAVMAGINQIIMMIPVLATALAMGIVNMITVLGSSMSQILPVVVSTITMICIAINTAAPIIINTIVNLIKQLLSAAKELLPELINLMVLTLKELLTAIQEITPDIIDTILVMLGEILDAIVDAVPMISNAGLELITGFLNSIANNIGGVVEAAVNIITSFLEAIGTETPRIVDAAFNMIISFIDGLTNSIANNGPRLASSISNLISTTISTAISCIFGSVGSFLEAGKTALGGFINGVTEKVKELWSKIKEKIVETIRNIKGEAKEFLNAGKDMVNGIIQGIQAGAKSLIQAGTNLAKSLIGAVKSFLGIKSPSIVFKEEVGHWIVQGITEGIEEDTSAEEAAKKKAQNIVNAFKEVLDKYDLEIDIKNKQYDLWMSSVGQQATPRVQYLKQLDVYTDVATHLNNKLKLANDEYLETVNHLGKDSTEAKEAYSKLLDAQIEVFDNQKKIFELKLEHLEQDKKFVELDQTARDKTYELWEKTTGEEASRQQKHNKLIEKLNEDYEQQGELIQKSMKIYKAICEQYGEDSIEAKEFLETIRDEQIAAADILKEINDTNKEFLDESVEILKSQYEGGMEISDLLYQIWEKTDGRKADDLTKQSVKLTTLAEQEVAQSQLVGIALENYKKICENPLYGKDSLEATQAMQEYYNAVLALVTTQSEILDIEENLEKRETRLRDKQKVAKDEYEKYLKQYKQYYLDNNMSLEELEKDARLISGYGKESIENSTAKGIQNGVNSVRNKTTQESMIKTYKDLGINCGEAFASGFTQEGPSHLESLAARAADNVHTIFSDIAKNTTVLTKSEMAQYVLEPISKLAHSINMYYGEELIPIGEKLGNDVVTGIENSFVDVEITGPVIVPVVDMSQVISGINGILGSDVSADLAYSIANNSDGYKQTSHQASGDTVVHNNYTQNNYSPKALSATEIYRQTNNLISTHKGRVTYV